jgi:protein TonB
MSINPAINLKPITGERTAIVALVLAAHGLTLAAWNSRTPAVAIPPTEMVVSLTAPLETPAPAPTAIARTEPTPRKVESPAVSPATTNVSPPTEVPASAQTAAPAMASPEPATVADTEPDYKASYLRNPSPVYPLAARRMGLQGKVVLNVEVLAEGRCGLIEVKQSSGYAMLDNAALQTVRDWRFVPARHAGIAVTRWFLVPVQFQLRNEES